MSSNTDASSSVSAATAHGNGPSSKPSDLQPALSGAQSTASPSPPPVSTEQRAAGPSPSGTSRLAKLRDRSYLALCTLAISILPLATPTGRNLEYEYATLVAWLLILLLPVAGVFAPTAVLEAWRRAPGLIRGRILWLCIGAPVALAAVPALVFAFGLCPCSRPGFTFWQFMQSAPALLLGHAGYFGALRMRAMGSRPRALMWRWLIILGLIALAVGAELWFSPQKRITNLFTGFLHGPIYDEFIAMDRGILLARQSHFVIAAACLFAVTMAVTRRYLVAVGSLLMVALIINIMAGTYPSTRHGHEALQEYLRGTMVGDGFILHYRPERLVDDKTGKESFATEPTQAVKWVFNDSLFHMRELREIFGRPPRDVHIYLYPDAELKKLHFGGGSTDVADVVTPSIHITQAGWPHPTLRHELVHAVAAHLGYKGLGFHPNMAFTEGLATALAPVESTLSLDEGVANLIKNNKLPKMESLFSPLFWSESASIAYTVSGSFLQFLINAYGIEGVKKLYSGSSWKEAFRVSAADVVAKWQQKISFGVDPSRLDLAAEQIFRDPGVLADRCPHSKADQKRDRADGFFVRMRQPLGWDPEQDYWPWRLRMAPSDREAQLSSLKSVVGQLAGARVLNRPALAEYLTEAGRRKVWPPKTIEDVEFALLESDLQRLLDEPQKSAEILKQIEPFAKSGRLSEGLVRAIYARLRVEQFVQGPRALSWRKFIAGWRSEPPERGEAEPWILTYLRVRRGDKGLTTPSGLATLMAAGIDQELPQTFRTEWYKIIADQYMRQGDYGAARNAYEFAVRNAYPGRIQALEESVRRAQFYADLGKGTKLGDNR